MSNVPFEQVVKEGAVVGIVLIVIAYFVSYLVNMSGLFKVDLPKDCKKWNEKYVMEITLFLSGLLFHVLFEYTGLNKYYVDNYPKSKVV
jgi:hypothetical protein